MMAPFDPHHADAARVTDLDERLRTLDAARTPTPDGTLPVRVRRGIARHRRRQRQAASLGVAGLVAVLAIGVLRVPPGPRPESSLSDRVAGGDAAVDPLTRPDSLAASEDPAPPRSLVLIELDLVRQRMASLATATRRVGDDVLEPTS
jgi:hypothetical protein